MTEKLRVRIGITTKNRPEYLVKCLSSCVEQSYEPKEIVVWDNSDDPEAVRQNAEVESSFPTVRWIRPAVQKSLIETRAEMMALAGCDLFCSIDDDGWFMGTDELETAVCEMEKDAACAGVAFDILTPDGPDPVTRQSPRSTTHFVGCGHMLRCEMVRSVGSYADFPGWYGAEEKDLCIRFMERGCSMKFLPGVHVWHDKTEAGRDWCAQHRSGTLNDLTFALLRCPWPTVLAYLPANALAHIRWGLSGRREERWSGFLGVWDFMCAAPSYVRNRHPVSRGVFRRFLGRGEGPREKPRDWEGKER
jgi:GT2 family glycosyltransferase